MTEFVQTMILGLGIAAIYGLLGQGVLVIYRGTGVVNFGQGAIALVGAAVVVETQSTLGGYGAFALAIGVGVVTAILFQNLVIWPLRNAAPIARIIATLGLLIAIQSAAFLRYGSTPVPVLSYLPLEQWTLGPLYFPSERIIIFAICVMVTAVLALYERYTLTGLATRAAAENDTAAAALGWSPNRLGTISWAIGGGLAGGAGALIVPVTGMIPATLTLLIVPALAAALVGRFDSFWLTLLGAGVLGISQSLLQRYWPQTGVVDAVPFVAVILLLVITGRGLPVRGHVSDRLPKVGTGRINVVPLIISGVIGIVLMGWVLNASFIDAFTVSIAAAVVLLSIVVLTGYAGQISLAQYAMAGLGAYVAGRLVAGAGWPFEVAALAGVLAAIPMGLVFAIPAMRTRGVSLAVVSLGMGVAVHAAIFNNVELTGGFEGTSVGTTTIFGINISAVTHADRYGIFTLVVFILAALIVANLRRSAAGRRLIAIRENERAAASLGVSVVGSKLYAFSVGSALAAVGGILIAFRGSSILYTEFDPFKSIFALALSVLGGVGYVVGPLAGSVLIGSGVGSLLEQVFHTITEWLPVIGGVAVITTLLLNPNGMIPGTIDPIRRALARRRARKNEKRSQRRERALANVVIPDQADLPANVVAARTLEVEGATVRYGGVVAVNDVSLSVRPGAVVGLIGPNGAGKTSFIDAVSGYARLSGGRVILDGHSINGMPVHRRVLAGVARSWQSLELLEDLSVYENLQIASEAVSWRPWHGLKSLIRPRAAGLNSAAWAAVHEFDLVPCLAKLPGNLSYSERRLVAIARAVALNPSVLLLDEPAAGLSSLESAELGALVRRLADKWGMGILLVEHDVDLVMSICDEIHVLEFGRHIASGSPKSVQENAEVIRAYLGVGDAEPASAIEIPHPVEA